MNATPFSSAALRARFDTRPVAYRHDQALRWDDFHACVSGIAAALARRSEHSWAVCCGDAFHFLAAFCAALAAGKRVIIPPNFQPGTLASLVGETQGWLVDRPEDEASAPGVAVAASAVSGPLAEFALAPDAVIDLYTSGTTGQPKRVRKHLHQLAAETAVLESLWGPRLGHAAVVGTVPHHHIYGLLFRLLWPLYAGRPFDVVPSGAPDELLKRLRFFGRAPIVSSPAQLSRWPELVDLATLLPHAVCIFSSGGPLAASTATRFAQVLGSAPIEVYGSSETGGIAWRTQNDEASDAWTPSPRVEVRLGADSALEVRSPFIGSNAWFTMADSALLLADGKFRLRGRLDRVVKIEEKRLSLPEIEQRLARHPWVAEAAAVVLEGERRLLGLVVILSPAGRERLRDEGKRRISGELKGFLAQYYEPALLPRRWRFPDAMPHNDRGKLSAAALTALFSE